MPAPEWLRKRREKQPVVEDASLWEKCPKCSEMVYRKDLDANMWVCPKCGYHFRMHAYDRINSLVDADFVEIGTEFLPSDPLGWIDKRPYTQKLETDREKSKLSEAVVTGFGTVAAAVCPAAIASRSQRETAALSPCSARSTSAIRRAARARTAAG